MYEYHRPLCTKTELFELIFLSFLFLKIVIASIMCSYNRNDWMELSRKAEVVISLYLFYFFSSIFISFK